MKVQRIRRLKMDLRHEFNLYAATMSYRLRMPHNITIIVQSRAYWRIPNMVINAYALHVHVQSYTTLIAH